MTHCVKTEKKYLSEQTTRKLIIIRRDKVELNEDVKPSPLNKLQQPSIKEETELVNIPDKNVYVPGLHKNTEVKSFSCIECGKSFRYHSALKCHRLIHSGERPFKCEQCGKTFLWKSRLMNHVRTHTKNAVEKRVICDVCGEDFSSNASLKAHRLRIHSEIRPYPCEYCEKSFRDSYTCLLHVRIHTGEKPFACDVCGTAFSVKRELTIHKRIHSGETPYQCEYCQKVFRRKEILATHVRIHTGETPYKCNVCKLTFKRTSELYRHKFLHKGETFQCDKCGKQCPAKYLLKKHERTHSRKETQLNADINPSASIE